MSNWRIPRSNVVHATTSAGVVTWCGKPLKPDDYRHPFASDMVATDEDVTCKRCLKSNPDNAVPDWAERWDGKKKCRVCGARKVIVACMMMHTHSVCSRSGLEDCDGSEGGER